MLVVRRASDDAAVAGQDVHRDDRVVHEAVAEGRGLDPNAGDGAAQRDRLELRDDGGHRSDGERGVGEVDEGRHSLRLDEVGFGIDADDLVEMSEIDGRRTPARAVAKQVRRLLRQPDGGVPRRARRRETVREARRLLGVGGHGPGWYRKARLIG